MDKRRSESLAEGLEVKQLLRKLNMIKDPLIAKTTDQLARELGYREEH